VKIGGAKSIRNYWTYFIIFLLFLAVYFRWVSHGWEKIVDSDGRGYFAYLPAVFTYHDLDFRYFFSGKLDVPADYTNNFLFIIDERYVIKYPPGVALMLAPFYLLAMLFTFVFGFDPSGYSFFYQVYVSIAAISYSLLGVKWVLELLKRMHVHEKVFPWIALALLFGTNLTVYMIHEPSMSHAFSFAAVSGFLLFIKRFMDGGENKNLLKASVAFGVILLIRPVNGIAVFGLLFLLKDFDELKKLFYGFFNDKFTLVKCLFAFALIVFIQPLLWYLQNGHWYVWTYLGESFRWENPEIMKVLFSYRKGWLLYTPYMLLLIPSFLMIIFKRDLFKILGILFFWGILIYVISSWWCWYYGGSFGQRAFIEFYPVAILSFAPLLLWMEGKIIFKVFQVFTILCVVFNLIQSYQYRSNILHYDSMNKQKYWSVFLRTDVSYEWKVFINPNEMVPERIQGKEILKSFTDFESCSNGSEWMPCKSDYIDTAVSGNHVALFGAEESYSPMYKKIIGRSIVNPSIFVRGFAQASLSDPGTHLVIAVDDSSGQNVFKVRKSIVEIWQAPNQDLLPYRGFEFECLLPPNLHNETIVVYLISPHEKVKLDDLFLVLFE